MSEAQSPRSATQKVTVEDVRKLMGASTPHFALQLRNRIRQLIAPLAADDAARLEGEREIARLDQIAFAGEVRGTGRNPAERPLASLVEGGSLDVPPAAH